jgi:hypothetical protein
MDIQEGVPALLQVFGTPSVRVDIKKTQYNQKLQFTPPMKVARGMG